MDVSEALTFIGITISYLLVPFSQSSVFTYLCNFQAAVWSPKIKMPGTALIGSGFLCSEVKGKPRASTGTSPNRKKHDGASLGA